MVNRLLMAAVLVGGAAFLAGCDKKDDGSKAAPTQATSTPIVDAVDGTAKPVFANAQDKGKAMKSLTNIKHLSTACRLYAVDHDGKLPAKLEDLVPDYVYADANLLISPFAPEESAGYVYHAGLTDTSPRELVVIEDKFSPNFGHRVVGRLDLSTEVIPVKE